MDGRFEGNQLLLDLEISSPISTEIKATHTFGIDTGFTNDICITYKEAFPLALSLVGVQEYTIADGSKVPFFECLGVVTYGDKKITAPISIRPSGSLLVGVNLLRKLGVKLEADFVNNTVCLTESTITVSEIKTPTETPPDSNLSKGHR